MVYIALLESLRAFGNLRLVIFAAMLILCVIFLPGGLISVWLRWQNRVREN